MAASQPPEADGRVPTLAFSIREFCDGNGISRSLYYEIRKAGSGPVFMR